MGKEIQTICARGFDWRADLGLFLRISPQADAIPWPEGEKMLLAEILGFWLVVSVALFGLRHRANGKESGAHAVLLSNVRRG